jgi:hypothetical protein
MRAKSHFNCLRSSKLKALKGRTILARGKRESASVPPRVTSRKFLPLTAKPRESASLVYGLFHNEPHDSWFGCVIWNCAP